MQDPYPGATEIIQTRSEKKAEKKKLKKLKKKGITCTCGLLEKYLTSHPRYHDSECIINTRSIE